MRYRAKFLARCRQLSDELVAASGVKAAMDIEPPDPPRDVQRRLRRAILAVTRAIRKARGHDEVATFRVDPAAAYRAAQLLASGVSEPEIRRRTGLGRKALATIRRGDAPRPLGSQSIELARCGNCGGLVAADAPCLLCKLRARKSP